MRIEPQKSAKVADGSMNLSIRKPGLRGKRGHGSGEKAMKFFGETVLSVRSDRRVASTAGALSPVESTQVLMDLSIRSDACVASASVAMGLVPSFLSIRSGACVASVSAALGLVPMVLSVRSDVRVASANVALSQGLMFLSIRSGFGVASAEAAFDPTGQ